MKNKNILTIIAIIMLTLAILDGVWPYGYYQILRIVVTLVCGYLAFLAYDIEKQNWIFVMIGLVILFNPIFPIFLTKEIWVFFDIFVAIILFISLFKLKK